MARQYLFCKFNPWARKSYAWHNDGAPVAVGAQVEVPTTLDGVVGTSVVTVETVSGVGPGRGIETKPIVRVLP